MRVAVIHVGITPWPNEPHGTGAEEVVNQTSTGPTIQAREDLTDVQLHLTVHTCEAREAVAEVGVHSILAGVCVGSVAGGTETVVNVGLTQGATETRGTGAHEGPNTIQFLRKCEGKKIISSSSLPVILSFTGVFRKEFTLV